MEFERIGNGTVNIIFLHGWGAGKSSFMWLQNYLLDCTMHFASLDGFDGTEPPQDPTICGYAKRLEKYIVTNKLEHVILVGHSFGGRIAIEYCANHDILGLVLVDSAGIKPKFSFKKTFSVLKYKLVKWCVKHGFLAESKLNKFGSEDYKTTSSEMKKVLVYAVNYDETNLTNYIKTKTLIIWGAQDTETPLYMAKKLNKNIKNSELIVLNGGHFSFLDNRYQFYRIIEYFSKEVIKSESKYVV